MQKKQKNQYAQAVQNCHELLIWLIHHLDKFPRARRYTLGAHLENRLLEILECLVDAAYSRQKTAPLKQANKHLEICRHLWRIALELRLISMKSYEHGILQMDNIGRQIGGWIRSCQ
ncbi:diversity-generating retroelement protein Avd [Candidatus Venteria ishoeyi]|uniref:diversity-generating retroelement protein Avd n=1 Tax=Candidatus Venteria ishoeyi TaxID=1899563 RepID=UPI0025A6006D|nr:diversity-generating retroelement protein Avd [Candidatus Venteria ishoeyi]MDM8545982.1 diversity-generating retroelement protein Avd [Candidatus Venteria ishoeyi]